MVDKFMDSSRPVSRRHALVIGSQCDALPNSTLSFLPERAEQLYKNMTDPARGGCDPKSSVLLLDPSMRAFKKAVKKAVDRAGAEHATLLFAFVGHAVTSGDKYVPSLFLMPKDGNAQMPSIDTGYEVGPRLISLNLKALNGLVLILDACYAGEGARNVIERAMGLESHLRMELLAATFSTVAKDGCFSKSLISLMEAGETAISGDYLYIRDSANLSTQSCSKQPPAIYIGSGRGSHISDPGLWVSRNIAAPGRWILSGTAEGGMAVSLTEGFQGTETLLKVAATFMTERLVVLTGGAGSGKSALIAALARPELIWGLSGRFISGVVFATLTETLEVMADHLKWQLMSISGFTDARMRYESALESSELDLEPVLEREIFGPLRELELSGTRRVRLVFDDLDRLAENERKQLLHHIAAATIDPKMRRVSFLVSCRTPLKDDLLSLPDAVVIEATPPGQDEREQYLRNRRIALPLAESLATFATSWLELRLLSEVAIGPGSQAPEVSRLDELYTHLLHSLTADETGANTTMLRILGAAGSGPVLPTSVAVAAATQLGGFNDDIPVLNAIPTLDELMARAHPGTPEELVGLFHDTLVQHIRLQESPRFSLREAHSAILEALVNTESPAAENYVREHEADHLWELDRYQEAIQSVITHLGVRPLENVRRLQKWIDHAGNRLPANDTDMMKLRYSFYYWTGKAGEVTEALSGFTELLQDRLRIPDADRKVTMQTRRWVAVFTGKNGDLEGSERQLRGLLEDMIGILGPDDEETLRTRAYLAIAIGKTGQPAEAVAQLRRLLDDRIRVLGSSHPDVLTTRANLAMWTGKEGHPAEAVVQYSEILRARLKTSNPDDRKVLTTRANLAYWIGKAGDPREAAMKFKELLADRLRVLGPDDPDTLTARANLALWTGKAGDAEGALKQYAELLADRVRLLGPDHRQTLRTRANIASLVKQAGRANDAADLRRELLQDRKRALGPNDPDTLITARQVERHKASQE